MEYLRLCIFISGLVTLSQQSINYRLPNDSMPHHYKLKFIPHIIPGNFTFDGESEIFLEVLTATRNLTLHSLNLEIDEEITMLIGENEIIVPNQHIFEEEPEFFILNFSDDLLPGNYLLQLKFTGFLNNKSKGFFWDSYVNDDNETVYLVATQFETTHAREAFPCWDEPALKATFDISIKNFPNYTALSNMPVKKIINDTEIDGKIWTNFETTPPMSTYIVAFAVSDFVNITNPEGNFSVWSRKNALDSMEFGYDVGLKAFPVLEVYTNIPYEFRKMDVIAIPSYLNGAMENWGLIVFKEEDILRNSSSSESEILKTYKFMVHEVAHQWFGNLVSPAWWKDLWLTEGLASYFHFFLTSKVMNFSRMMDFFLVSNTHNVYARDENPLSLPLSRDVNSSNETRQLLNLVHEKAATMMHMLSGLISEEVFHTGIRKLLQRYKFKTITTDDFWETMQEALNKSKFPNNNFDIKKVMDPFVSQIGYPVINVFRDYTTGTIKLTQECPVCLENNNNNTESKFWIPINFATSSSLNFSSTFATHWMNPEENALIIEGVDPNDWIIINIQSSAYYRVNYDEENWNKIADYLNSDKFSNIHVLNRAQLLEDAFWLFKQDKLDKDFLIYLNSYVTRELDYIPWVPCDNFLIYLETIEDVQFFKNYVLRLVEGIVNDTGLDERKNEDFFTGFKRFIGIYWSCLVAKLHCSKVKW